MIPETQLESHTSLQSHSTTQREYIFALFLLRYRLLDVGLWLWRCSQLKTPRDIIRISLPDTKDIVSSRIVTTNSELILYSRPSSKNYAIGQASSSLSETFVLAHVNPSQ